MKNSPKPVRFTCKRLGLLPSLYGTFNQILKASYFNNLENLHPSVP